MRDMESNQETEKHVMLPYQELKIKPKLRGTRLRRLGHETLSAGKDAK
jgi:hypothetical protein